MRRNVSKLPHRHVRAAGFLIAVLSAAPFAGGQYTVHYLVSDGFIPADHVDANLLNPWGIVFNPNGFVWVANNHTGTSTLYDGLGNPQSLIVTIPSPSTLDGGSPTGITFSGSPTDFMISSGGASGPARFIFVGEDGTISGWNPNVPAPAPPPSTQAFVAVDDSKEKANYKGVTIAMTKVGARLYTTDFHNNSIDAYDNQFVEIKLEGDFSDPAIPEGFAPFNIATIDDHLFVSYAMQDKEGKDEVPGPGLGYVNEFDTEGVLVRHFVSSGPLNAPWGMVKAPPTFGEFAGAILIGNFGDGRVNAFAQSDGRLLGPLADSEGKALEVEGLWGMAFGNGLSFQPTHTLFFAAGVGDEEHGAYGRIDPPNPVDFNHDGIVSGPDLEILLSAWGPCPAAGAPGECPADLDGDGIVDGFDLAMLLGVWG